MKLKRDPSVVPARTHQGISTSHYVEVLVLTVTGRVEGKECWISGKDGTLQTRDFSVKCTEKGFSLGSGSSKKRYYFEDWEKVPL